MNGYPDYLIEKTIARKLKTFTSPTSYTVKKCPVYLYLPWLGTPSVGLKNNNKAIFEKCFFAVEKRVIFTSCPPLPAIKNDMLPASLLSNALYKFSSHCDNRYVDLNNCGTEFANTYQNLLESGKFRTLAIFLLVLANLQLQLCLVNVQLVTPFR